MNPMVRRTAEDALKRAGSLAGLAGRWAAYALIWSYRLLVKPLFPTSCRFEPSCSQYALEAVRRFGALRGGLLAARRLGRCNPWGPFGPDPVPEHWPLRFHVHLRSHRRPAPEHLRREPS